MPIPRPADYILEQRFQAYIRNNCNSSAASRELKIAESTFKKHIDFYKELHPEKFDNAVYQARNGHWTIPATHTIELKSGSVLIGGDLHIWPGQEPAMWNAFCKIAWRLKPQVIVLNGDIIDGARVSRHGALLGQQAPKVNDEVIAAQKLLGMLPNAQHKIWTMGNHDIRVDNYLANQASELEDYAGKLSDRFPNYKFCYAVVVNEVEIRHRFRGGIHSAWNNALHSGVTIVTGHTHQLQVTAVRNRHGSHWGIEGGMLADPNSKQFEYAEGAPSRAQEGFVVLSFDEDGKVMPPELCEMVRGYPVFRGQKVF